MSDYKQLIRKFSGIKNKLSSYNSATTLPNLDSHQDVIKREVFNQSGKRISLNRNLSTFSFKWEPEQKKLQSFKPIVTNLQVSNKIANTKQKTLLFKETNSLRCSSSTSTRSHTAL